MKGQMKAEQPTKRGATIVRGVCCNLLLSLSTNQQNIFCNPMQCCSIRARGIGIGPRRVKKFVSFAKILW